MTIIPANLHVFWDTNILLYSINLRYRILQATIEILIQNNSIKIWKPQPQQ